MSNTNPFIQCPDCVENRNKLRAIVLDCFPTERVKANLMVISFDAGIASSIQRANTLDPILRTRLLKTLTEDYGIADHHATWVVDFWLLHYGKEVLGKDYRLSTQVALPVTNKPKSVKPIHAAPIHNSAPQLVPSGFIDVAKMKDGEKIPADRIILDNDGMSKYGIKSFRLSARLTNLISNEAFLQVGGEYEGTPKKTLVILIMTYNERGELINLLNGEEIDEKSKGRKNFSSIITVPKDEHISCVKVKLIPDPVWLDN